MQTAVLNNTPYFQQIKVTGINRGGINSSQIVRGQTFVVLESGADAVIGLINSLLRLSERMTQLQGRIVSNIQGGECSRETPINHGDLGRADELWCRRSIHAAAESLATTVTQDRTDMEANQQL